MGLSYTRQNKEVNKMVKRKNNSMFKCPKCGERMVSLRYWVNSSSVGLSKKYCVSCDTIYALTLEPIFTNEA
jgi:transcription elongation factor Elf1